MAECTHDTISRLRYDAPANANYICTDDKDPACHQTFEVKPTPEKTEEVR